MNRNKLTEFASEYLEEGISILPIKKDKRPVVKWAQYQNEPPSLVEVGEWPARGTQGLAWIMGEVSGGMEALDFDFKHGFTIENYKVFEKLVGDIANKVLRQKTPTGGRHWIYRCKEIEGNQKLCLNKDGEAMIETRGEGGYICVGPMPGYQFQNVNGGGVHVPEISILERRKLLAYARSMGTPVLEKKKSSSGKLSRKEVPSFPPSFIDYSNDHKIEDLVEEDGWVFLDKGKDSKNKTIHRYERDGGDGVGASLYPDDNTFYVFTTAQDVFPTQQMMNPAEYIMYRDFGGDEEAMLEWLEEEGYPNEEKDERVDREKVVKLRLKKDIKEKRYINNLVHTIKAVAEIRYNEIRQVFETKLDHKQAVYMDEWNGLDSRAIHGMLLAQGVSAPYQKVQHVLADMGNWERVDPVKEWLKGLEWDGVHRINELASYIKCKDNKRWRLNFKKHLVRCVRQLFLEGVNRYALILHSDEQGNGKSTFIRSVIECGVMKYYYSEDLPKETSEFGVARFVSMSAHANIEELDGFGKKDIDHLKALTTRKDVAMRKMRTDAMFTVPRRVNFWGSTNKAQFLTDTRNTRWIINEVEEIDWDYSDVDMDQVWAEAVVLYESDFVCDLSSEEISSNEEVADEYKNEIFPTDLLLEVFEPCDKKEGVHMNATEVMDDLKLYYSESDTVTLLLKSTYINKFGSLLKSIGFTTKKTKGKQGYVLTPTDEFLKHKLYDGSNCYKKS